MNCQSCGMPMQDGDRGGNRPDNAYCKHCTDDMGNLKSREEVKEGMIAFYMQTLGKTREEAQVAVDAHMTQMPAWSADGPAWSNPSQNQPTPVSAAPEPINQLGVEEPTLPAQQPEMDIQTAPQMPNEPVAAPPEVQAPEPVISSEPSMQMPETQVQLKEE